MIAWLSANNGFIMAVLTFVYVVATVIICILNYQSTKAAKEQTDELKRQYGEDSKGRIYPYIVNYQSGFIGLMLKNIGRNTIFFTPNIRSEWINAQDNSIKEIYNTLNNSHLAFSPGQEQLVTLGVPPKFKDNPANNANIYITINYRDGRREEISYNIDLYRTLFVPAPDNVNFRVQKTGDTGEEKQ